jgi:hypothetical protein
MKKLFKNLLCLLAFGWILPAQAQMTIQNGNEVSITNILQELVGEGVVITNVKILTGGAINNTANAKRMYGIYKYTATPDLLGLTSGLVMSSGRVISEPNIVGINASSGSFASHDMGFGADPYLPASLDAIAIEFDMVPVAPIMYFNYMFASEEYPEYVCTQFNDIFKFVVSGPNPSNPNSPYTFSNTNIAIVPDTGVPGTANPGTDVAINTVHQGSSPGGQGCPSGSSNPQYHNKNADNLTVFDQRTKGLFAKLPVTPLATYKLRLIVGDRGDRIFDTGVFIEKVNTNIPAFNADIHIGKCFWEIFVWWDTKQGFQL